MLTGNIPKNHASGSVNPDSRAPASEGLTTAARWQQISAWVGFFLLLALLAMRYVILVRLGAMEFDQICTLITAEASSLRAYLAALPIDSQPPLSHVAARIGLALPLPQSIGVHIFSGLAIGLTAFCLFRVFERRGAALAGLCSAAMFTASRCVNFMFTVRPYAALMAVSAAAVLVYDTYRQRRKLAGRPRVWPIVSVIVLAATVHALSLLYVLAPILLGEMYEWMRSRRIDWRLLIASGLASCTFVFDFLLARRVQGQTSLLLPISARTPGLPTAAKFWDVLTFPIERRWQAMVFAAVLATAIFLWRGTRGTAANGDQEPGAADPFYPFLAALAMYLAACLAFAAGAVNHYFYTRYASPVFVGGALLLGAVLSLKGWRRAPVIQLALALVLLFLPLPALVSALKSGQRATPREQNSGLFQHGQLIASPLAYPTLWWYATPQQRGQMRLLTDPDHFRNIPDGIPEATLRSFAAAGLLPFALTPLADFPLGSEIYLVAPTLSGDTWVPAFLTQQGYRCAVDPSFQSDAYTLTRCIR